MEKKILAYCGVCNHKFTFNDWIEFFNIEEEFADAVLGAAE